MSRSSASEPDGADALQEKARSRVAGDRDPLSHIRKFDQVGRNARNRLATEAGIAIDDVVTEARLAGLAVTDDVDTDAGLSLDQLLHHGLDSRFYHLAVDVVTVQFPDDHVDEVEGARQAADMRGENPVDTSFHLVSPAYP